VFDLDAYLERIGLHGRPGLADVHLAHATSIPFENLDPHRGIPVSLAEEDLERKLVRERRGGYCFEHNLLLKAAFEELGASVEPMLARVRVGGTPARLRPRSHLVLRVRAGGESFYADVGFGAGTPLRPLSSTPGFEQEQSGWRFRLRQEAEELVLESAGQDGRWQELYGFVPQPVPRVDIETSNWFTCTHPRSPFVAGLVAAAQSEDGTRVRLSDWDGLSLTAQTPAGETSEPLAREQIPQLLEERFGLGGFELDAGGRVRSIAGS